MIKSMLILLFFLTGLSAYGENNVEINAKMIEDDKNFIYMESSDTKYTLIKKELTPEGVAQMVANKGKNLIIFVPPKSIKKQVLITAEGKKKEGS